MKTTHKNKNIIRSYYHSIHSSSWIVKDQMKGGPAVYGRIPTKIQRFFGLI